MTDLTPSEKRLLSPSCAASSPLRPRPVDTRHRREPPAGPLSRETKERRDEIGRREARLRGPSRGAIRSVGAGPGYRCVGRAHGVFASSLPENVDQVGEPGRAGTAGAGRAAGPRTPGPSPARRTPHLTGASAPGRGLPSRPEESVEGGPAIRPPQHRNPPEENAERISRSPGDNDERGAYALLVDDGSGDESPRETSSSRGPDVRIRSPRPEDARVRKSGETAGRFS